MYEVPDLSRLSEAEKDALILALFGQVEQLMARLAVLGVRMHELEALLRNDSHNSSTIIPRGYPPA